MNGPLKLAIKYIAHNKFKSLILISCIFLTALLPIAIKLLLWQFNNKLLDRSDRTPIVIGAKGSSLDLTLNSLYFKTQSPETIPFSETKRIQETGLAVAIPLHTKFTSRKFPLVGTSIEYLDFRGLRFASGDAFTTLGDCVIGSAVAASLDLKPGDKILSDRENVLDIAGLYPLKMHITGVLAPSNSADDRAVLVDVKTAWVIQGLGHGHEDLTDETDEGKVLSRTDNSVVASAAVLPFTEISQANLDSFHFHGNTEDFPITSIIAIAHDTKSETILESQYDVGIEGLQFVRPGSVVRELMNMVFRIKLFFDANAILIAISTVLLMLLVVTLSMRLRKREMQTMFKIGCSRGTIIMLQFWEMAIIFFIAFALLAAAVFGIWQISGSIVESLLLSAGK